MGFVFLFCFVSFVFCFCLFFFFVFCVFGFWFLVFWFLVFGFWLVLVFGFWFLVFGFFGFWFLVFGFWFCVFGFVCLVLCVWFCVFGFVFLCFVFCVLCLVYGVLCCFLCFFFGFCCLFFCVLCYVLCVFFVYCLCFFVFCFFVCERTQNKRKDGTFHRGNATPCTMHHYTSTSTARAGALMFHHPAWVEHHTGGSRSTTHGTPVLTSVRRLWVAQPRPRARAGDTQTSGTKCAQQGCRSPNPGRGAKVRGTEAWSRSRVANYGSERQSPSAQQLEARPRCFP